MVKGIFHVSPAEELNDPLPSSWGMGIGITYITDLAKILLQFLQNTLETFYEQFG